MRTRVWRHLAVALAAAQMLGGCGGRPAHAPSPSRNVSLTSAKTGRKVPQTELQQDIERFSNELLNRLADAMEPLAASKDPGIRNTALRLELAYASSTLEITTGLLPEVSVLDMMVFVRLAREVFEKHWMPTVFGASGNDTVEAFRASEAELWKIADKILDEAQKKKLLSLIEEWRAANPDQIRVEEVRLSEFSRVQGARAMQMADDSKGLLADVSAMTATVDQALLFAERGLFLTHRLPFLLRLQARLGSIQIVDDAKSDLSGDVRRLEPLARGLPDIVETSGQTVRDARLLAKEVQPLVPPPEALDRVQETMTRADGASQNALAAVRELKELAPGAVPSIDAATKRADELMKRATLYAISVGVAWAIAFWLGYYLVKRRKLARVAGG